MRFSTEISKLTTDKRASFSLTSIFSTLASSCAAQVARLAIMPRLADTSTSRRTSKSLSPVSAQTKARVLSLSLPMSWMLLQNPRCTAIPWPALRCPTIVSPGIGRQQREYLIIMPSVPWISIGPMPLFLSVL